MVSNEDRPGGWWPLAATFAVGAAFTIAAFGIAYDIEGQKVRRQFDRDAAEHVASIRRSLDSGLHDLESVVALFASSEEVTRDEFASFSRSLLQRGRTLQALEWAPRVEGHRREAFEAQVRSEGFPDFEIREREGGMRRARERGAYYPALFVEPFAGNQIVLGFDLSSTPDRREAIERALQTGEATATAPVELAQGPRNAWGVLVVAPVTNEPRAQRAAGSIHGPGVAAAVIRCDALVESSLRGMEPPGIDVDIEDVTAGSAPRLIHRFRSAPGTERTSVEPERVEAIEVAGRRWRATSRATASYRLGRRAFEPWILLIAGIVLTSITTAYVAARRRSEDGIRAMNLRLARSNFDLTRLRHELEATLQREQEAGRLKSQFVSMASHEFRTPLSGILSASQALERYADRMTPDQRRSRFEAIESEIRYMTRMLESVMLLGRADLERLECLPQPVDVPRLCDEVVADVARDEGSAPRVDLETSGFDGELDLDRTLVRHIVSNLLSNAVKYSRPGGVVRLEARREGNEVVFRVHDEGIGIPDGDRERIFESFQRAANVGEVPGTGLGLAVARRAAESHGGTIVVESAVGRGSTFTVRLPAPAAEGRRAGRGA